MSGASVGEGIAPGRNTFGRARRWSGILAVFFSAQSSVQLLGVLAGLLFVNFLPLEQFALYTLANSILAFTTFASDLGSSGSLVYFYRATASEPEGFAAMIAAVRSLRRDAFLVGALATAVALPWVAHRRGLPYLPATLCAAGVIVGVWFQIRSSLGLLALRLHGAYGRAYRAEIAGGLLRLTLASLVVGLGLRVAWLAVLSGACATALVALLVRDGSNDFRSANIRRDRRRVIRYLLPSLPSALYFSIQTPLVVWLSATFGSTRTIAEVGAIGRLGLLVGIFGGLTGVVFLPRLARIIDETHYRRRFFQFGAVLVALGGLLFLAAAVVPDLFLALLGPRYRGLQSELLLVVAGAWISLVSGYLVSVNLSRAWNRWETLAVIVLFVSQVALVAVLDMGSTHGVLVFGLLSATVGALLQASILAIGFRRPAWVSWNP